MNNFLLVTFHGSPFIILLLSLDVFPLWTYFILVLFTFSLLIQSVSQSINYSLNQYMSVHYLASFTIVNLYNPIYPSYTFHKLIHHLLLFHHQFISAVIILKIFETYTHTHAHLTFYGHCESVTIILHRQRVKQLMRPRLISFEASVNRCWESRGS